MMSRATLFYKNCLIVQRIGSSALVSELGKESNLKLQFKSSCSSIGTAFYGRLSDALALAGGISASMNYATSVSSVIV
jgi:hypothetical protein